MHIIPITYRERPGNAFFLTFQVVGWADVFSTKDLGKYSFGRMKSSLTKLKTAN
jgi:hypothetical protein